MTIFLVGLIIGIYVGALEVMVLLSIEGRI